MNDSGRTPLVRPAFLKGSLIVFILLIPFVVHAAWDYYESRRLSAAIAESRAKGEPTTAFLMLERLAPLKGEAADASRYYRAAAALAHADQSDITPPHLRDEALRMVDLAASLPFEGFPPGTIYSYRYAELDQLGRLVHNRTQTAADPEQAGRSLYAQLRLLRPFVVGRQAGPLPLNSAISDIVDVLSRSRLDAESLERIQVAVGDLDRDDALRDGLLRERAAMLQQFEFRGPGFISRPFYLHMVNDRLDVIRVLLTGAASPWPQRLDTPKVAIYPRFSLNVPLMRSNDGQRFLAFARQLAMIRCASVAVAAARFARARGALPARIDDLIPTYLSTAPIDPFSGGAIALARESDGYRVFSAGRDRSDRPIEIRIAQP